MAPPLSVVLGTFLGSLLADLGDLVAPRRCAACGDTGPHTPPLCAVCTDALEPADAPPPGVTVPYAWGGPLGTAIARAKYSPSPATAAALGALLVPSARALVLPIDRVVPIPLHPVRLAARGYNQSGEMARAVARCLGVTLDHGLLRRTRDTPSQRTLGRAAREANVTGAFSVGGRRRGATGLRVLLVDDVVTTGATFAAACEALRRAGARSVHPLALARAPLEVAGFFPPGTRGVHLP